MAPASSLTMNEHGEQKASSSKSGSHSRGMLPAPPLKMDEAVGQKASSWKLGSHIQGMILAPPLMMGLGVESLSLGADYHTQETMAALSLTMLPAEETERFLEVEYRSRDRALTQLSMMKLGEGFSPLEVDYCIQGTGPSPIARCWGLQMDSLPPQVGREVRGHVRAMMAIASNVAVVAHEGLA